MNSEETTSETSIKSNEIQIKNLIERYGKGFREKNVKLILSVYAPDAVAFYEVDSLQIAGHEALKQFWDECISLSGTNNFETRQMQIRTQEDLGFCHFLSHIMCTTKDGTKINHWSRCTLIFEKINDQWFITHEHTSVPFNSQTGYMLGDLRPEDIKH